jgi:hypothetical protein
MNDANTAVSNISNILKYLNESILNKYSSLFSAPYLKIVQVLYKIVDDNLTQAVIWKQNITNNYETFNKIYNLIEVSKIACSQIEGILKQQLNIHSKLLIDGDFIFNIVYKDYIFKNNNNKPITDNKKLELKTILYYTHHIIFLNNFISNIINLKKNSNEDQYRQYYTNYENNILPLIMRAISYGNDAFTLYIQSDINTSPGLFNTFMDNANNMKILMIKLLQDMQENESIQIISSINFNVLSDNQRLILVGANTPDLAVSTSDVLTPNEAVAIVGSVINEEDIKNREYWDRLKSAINGLAFYKPYSNEMDTQHVSLKCMIARDTVDGNSSMLELECVSVNNPTINNTTTSRRLINSDGIVAPIENFDNEKEDSEEDSECDEDTNDKYIKIFVILLLLLLIYLLYLHNKNK